MSQKDLGEFASDETAAASETAVNQATETGFVPDSCVGFDIAADYAHFRRVGNNSAKPSYTIPPRTTIAGLLAGIMGMPRDSYYDLFSPESSAIAVVPTEVPRSYTMGITTVNTRADKAIQYLPKERSWQKGAEMLTPESYLELDRQRDTYEMLVDPEYRIYVGLADEQIHKELQDRLLESRYHYSPSLGLSECLAEISSVDIHSVTSTTTDRVDSIAYDDGAVVPQADLTLNSERAPLYMESTSGGRRTTAYGNITYPTDVDRLPINGLQPYTVGQDDVVFY